MRAIAINVGANTNEPGFRGPITADGQFTYLPIPESEPTSEPVPTYGDLDAALTFDVPEPVHDRPVHLDPEFATYPHCERYTYGDEHGIKAGPLSDLDVGDYLFFYATLSTTGETADWLPPEWGAFVIGHFRLARDPTSSEALTADERPVFANNAHQKRRDPDARVLLAGDPGTSMLYSRAVPLSTSGGGMTANALVTEHSSDSGAGPWWRRVLRFDSVGTETLLSAVRNGERSRWATDE
ncbi:MAG: hypothetical protein V5A34_01905 [Halapricum sp.]